MEYTTVVPVTGKTKEYCRAQHETKIQAAFAHKQGLTQNVKKSERRDVSTCLGQS